MFKKTVKINIFSLVAKVCDIIRLFYMSWNEEHAHFSALTGNNATQKQRNPLPVVTFFRKSDNFGALQAFLMQMGNLIKAHAHRTWTNGTSAFLFDSKFPIIWNSFRTFFFERRRKDLGIKGFLSFSGGTIFSAVLSPRPLLASSSVLESAGASSRKGTKNSRKAFFPEALDVRLLFLLILLFL